MISYATVSPVYCLPCRFVRFVLVELFGVEVPLLS